MRKQIQKTAVLTLAVSLVLAAGCTGNAVDDGDSAPVVLELNTMTAMPITGQQDPNNPGTCLFTIPEWTAEMANLPKNALAVTSPFNDIEMLDVTVAAAWSTGDNFTDVLGLAGTVPAAGTQSIRFFPVQTLPVLAGGETANLTMAFRGRTIAGDDVGLTTGQLLVVNACQ